jgi:hypothetical protein
MVDVVIGDIAGAEIPPPAEIERRRPLQRRARRVEVGFAVPPGVLEIVLQVDEEDADAARGEDRARVDDEARYTGHPPDRPIQSARPRLCRITPAASIRPAFFGQR